LLFIYENKTMMASLTGMDVSNASLYEGASALAEAILMAVRLNKSAKRILMPTNIHPYYRAVVDSIVTRQNIEIIAIPYDQQTGCLNLAAFTAELAQGTAALVIAQPNFFGALEAVDTLTDWARQHHIISIALVNPTALALLKEPGQWGKEGVDIVCGEGQALGVPLASGGPYFGFLCCKQVHVRQMPGRIVGRTVDLDGKPGFTLTLQAREQHIRRSKATSNICTNQGLMVTAATIYMSLVGPNGLHRVASASHHHAVSLRKQLSHIAGITPLFDQPFFHEFVVRLNKPVAEVLEKLADEGIQGGFNLTPYYPELGDCLLICTTETKTADDLQTYVKAMQKILQGTHTTQQTAAV
jgi:glycine dehydrogenase subunit 1